MPTLNSRPEQFQNFMARKPEGPLYMLNLYKFKEQAEYADGRHTTLTGMEAYHLFATGVVELIRACGGDVEFAGEANALVIGDGDLEWDSVAVVRHASFEAFRTLTQSESYVALSVHRDAGLAHQALINCLAGDQANPPFATPR